jgi:hypothetical protein
MSAKLYTWGELKKFAEAHGVTDKTLVIGVHPGGGDWKDEGMFDGITPYMTSDLWETRSGWIPTRGNEDTVAEYVTNGSYPALVMSTLGRECDNEWYFDGEGELT